MEPRPATARRRFGSTLAQKDDADTWRRALCAMVFDDPARIADALSHQITGRFAFDPHHHTDLLQLDVIHGCAGTATVDDREVPIEPHTTLLISPPGQLHGYSLRPAGNDAAVWLVKLRVGRDASSPLPPFAAVPSEADGLRRAMADFVRDWTPQGVGLLALTRLSNVIAHWPTSAFEAPPIDPPADEPPGDHGPSARVRRAIEAVAPRLDDPPDLAELAELASLSPRHFSRRFRQDFGCTPHAYLQARRLDAARGLLRDADRRVAGVAEQLGFSSPAAFSRWFTRLAGQSPRTFRDNPQNF